MHKIGLTGGIGSGKSTVAGILLARGVWLIDADELSRAATQPGGAAMSAIEATFGASVVTPKGSLDRDAMRQIMLSDANAKVQLEGLLHPLIAQQINHSLQEAEIANAGIAVLDIPLLVEGGTRWRNRMDAVWVVDCLPQTQIARVQARSQWPLAQIEAVMTAQSSRAKKLACADAVIYNEGISLKQLEQQVHALLARARS